MTLMRIAVTGMVLAGMPAPAGAGEKDVPDSATAEDVARALAFDEDSDIARAMSDVTDSVSQWRETAFYLLLKRLAGLRPLAEGELARLGRPTYHSLLAVPQWFRCRPLRITVRVHTVKRMTGRNMGADSLVWGADKPMWRLYCSDASVSAEAGPIVICSTAEPRGLGEPSKKTQDDKAKYPDDVLLYKQAPQVELACVFYKVYKGKRQDTNEARDYPVAMAWHVSAEGKAPGFNAGDPRFVAGAVAIIGICFAYYFIRKYTRRLGKPGPKFEYKPKRDEPEDEEPDEADDQPVDPLLAAAAEEYERERQDRDAEDHG